MRNLTVLLLSFALASAGQAPRRLTADQFPDADPAAVAPLVNFSELHTNPIANQPEGLVSQRLGAGDLVSISVSDCPDLTRNFRVNSAGLLKLPLLKDPIAAAGKEPSDIEDEVQRALIKEEILVQPVVSVAVIEYRSVPVSVMGAVRKPVTFQAVGRITLLDALAKAEGLNQDHGAEILVSRAQADGQAPLIQRISLNQLLVEADPAANIKLVGGEEIRVPAAGKVYVLGNVKKPGVYPLEEGDNTVMTMIAKSEGLMPYARNQAVIYRKEAGKNNEIPFDLGKLMDRKSPDVLLQASDILYIPDNKNKRLTNSIIDRIIGFGSATGTGLLVWH